MLSLAVLVFAELLLLFLAFCGLFLPHAVTKGAQLFAKGQIDVYKRQGYVDAVHMVRAGSGAAAHSGGRPWSCYPYQLFCAGHALSLIHI